MVKFNSKKNMYLILDSQCIPIARAILENDAQAEQWQIRVLENRTDQVLNHEIVQLVAIENGTSAMLGRIKHHRGDRIVLERLRTLGNEMRQNLRIATDFDSFIYPLSETQKGRLPIRGKNLCCGGVSFFCDDLLRIGELVEIVIPVTEMPLILMGKILRRSQKAETGKLYAAEFLDMIEDEAMMVQEAVYGIQIQNQGKHGGT